MKPTEPVLVRDEVINRMLAALLSKNAKFRLWLGRPNEHDRKLIQSLGLRDVVWNKHRARFEAVL